MPTLLRRRYKRERVPASERAIGVVILVLTTAIVVAFVVTWRTPGDPLFQPKPDSQDRSPNREAVAASSGMPTPGVVGWSPPGDVRVFTPANLWEKIDGRAEIYLSFHMVKMTFGTYRDVRDPGAFVDVYLYDMGEPDNAFGIYRAEIGSKHTEVDLGRGGYASPGGVFFWKGSHYVRVEASDAGQAPARAARAVAQALAARIEDDGRPLWADALLPAEDRAEDSFEYHAQDAFSLDFLRDTFSADYRVGSQIFKTFIHRAESAEKARTAFDAYAEFFNEFGSVLKRESRGGFEFVVGDSGGVIDAVFVVGRYLGGIGGIEDAELAEKRMLSFAETLTRKK